MSEIIAFIIKTCLVCIFTFLLTRIMSKKAMSQLSAFELAGIVIFSNIASQPIGTTSLTTTILAMFIITFLIMITGKLVLINKFSMILEDVPTVLVEGGKIDFKQLKKEYMSLNQFLALLREKGYDSVSEIDYVILEPSGQLSIFPIGEQKPITKKDLNFIRPEFGYSVSFAFAVHYMKPTLLIISEERFVKETGIRLEIPFTAFEFALVIRL